MEQVVNDIFDSNQDGLYLDDLHRKLSVDGLDNAEIQQLQDQFNQEIQQLQGLKQEELRELANSLDLDVVSVGWEDEPEDTSIIQEVVDLGMNEYQVKLGDTLWKIVSEHYDLIDHRAIANKINEVVDAQAIGVMATRLGKDTKPDEFPDGIKGDQLWAGDVIYLPPRLEKT